MINPLRLCSVVNYVCLTTRPAEPQSYPKSYLRCVPSLTPLRLLLAVDDKINKLRCYLTFEAVCPFSIPVYLVLRLSMDAGSNKSKSKVKQSKQ
jgi:hypothetical protein